MIGLSPKQLRKLTPGNGYTEKRMTKDGIEKSGDLWWSDNSCVFFEPAPEAVVIGKERRLEFAKMLGQHLAQAKTEVYPATIQGEDPHKKSEGLALKFSDGNGTAVWTDPKYVLPILRREKKEDIRWFTNGDTLVAKTDNRRIALLCLTTAPDYDPGWSFTCKVYQEN